MRTAYHQELARFRTGLEDLTRLAGSSIGQATEALLEDDVDLARQVTHGEKAINQLHHLLDDDAVNLLALQQPVAGELRTVVAGLRMSAHLDRMGALARHIAEIVERWHLHSALPEPFKPTIATMGGLAQRMTAKACEAMITRYAGAATELDQDDDEMDRMEAMLRRQVVTSEPPVPLDMAMDIALLGRYYERFADHAVSLASRVAYLAGRRQENPTP